MGFFTVVFALMCLGSCAAENSASRCQEELHEELSEIRDLLSIQTDRLAILEQEAKQLKKENSALKRDMDNLKKHCNNKAADDAAVFNSSNKSPVRRLLLPTTRAPRTAKPEVAFFSMKTKLVDHMGNHQPVVFDEVKVNHGGAYNGADGEFIAPVSGIYVFSWTTSNDPHSYMTTEMVINGQWYAHTWSDANDHEDVSVASVTCVTQLKQNDRVWIRSGNLHSGKLTCNGNSMCSFTGFLLY